MVMFNKDIGNVYHKHLKETLFQDGATETNLTQLVLKFIETIGFSHLHIQQMFPTIQFCHDKYHLLLMMKLLLQAMW